MGFPSTVYIFPPSYIPGYENYGGWRLCLVLYKCIDMYSSSAFVTLLCDGKLISA